MTRKQHLIRFGTACIVLGLCASVDASGTRFLLVESHVARTLDAAAGVYVQSIDLDRRSPAGFPLRLPGNAPLARMADASGHRAVMTTGDPWPGDVPTPPDTKTFTSMLQTNPLGTTAGGEFLSTEGWWQRADRIMSGPNGNEWLVVLGVRVDEYGMSRGRVDLRPVDATGSIIGTGAIIGPLPGVPVSTAPLADGRRLGILCHTADMIGAALHVLDLDTGRITPHIWAIRPEAQEAVTREPAGVWRDRETGMLSVAVWGYSATDPATRPLTWVYALDGHNLEALGPPTPLPGRLESHQQMVATTDHGTLWMVTREPGTDHVVVTEITLTEDGPEATERITVFGEIGPVRVAFDNTRNTLYMTRGNQLHAYRDGIAHGDGVAFGSSIRSLAVADGHVYIGEGARIHRLEGAPPEITATRTISSGEVTAIIPVEATEAEPTTRTGLTSNALVQFSSAVAARDGQTIPVIAQGAHQMALRWRIAPEQTVYPWLDVAPSEGAVPGHVTIRALPSTETGDLPALTGVLILEAMDGVTSEPLAASPAHVHVRVLPGQPSVRRLLWIADGIPYPHSDGPTFARLRDALAARPMLASHYIPQEPFSGSLVPYPVVVVTLDAAARGLISRTAMLDHIQAGGGLLFIARRPQEHETDVFNDWLMPFGIQTDSTQTVSGVYPASETGPLSPAWGSFPLQQGAALHLTDSENIVDWVNDDHLGATVFAAGTYGLGRFAIMAAPDPFTDGAFDNPDSRRFASLLFRWLLHGELGP